MQETTQIMEIKNSIKNCAPFTDCISEINNTQINNVTSIDVTKPMYNLIEHGNNYLKI